ncbi:zeta toxin family protein [Streptomyces sp. NPDC056549]|uniref:zeta toxin family protein n=1 Tax=Streptomyces sp. NPDC056549 TaxID=3345864 RepID=UPI00367415CE
MREVDRARYVLSEEENERIFRERIVPQQLAGTPQEQPIAVIVSGQTGAGKTAITALVSSALAVRGESVNVNLDTCKPHHPMFDELMESDDTTAGVYTSIDGHKWMEKSEAYAILQKFDIVMESALRDPRDFEEPAARLWAAGYQIEIPVAAVHESESRLGALDRYLQQIEAFGRGRKIDLAIHDACYQGVARATGNLDTGRLAHAVFVVRRDASVVYSNYLDPSDRWLREPDTPGAVQRERTAPWTEQQSRVFAGVAGRTLQRIEALPPEMRDSARQELAAVVALARPLVHPASYVAVQGALGPV